MPNDSIAFVPLAYEHLPLIFRWRNTPHVLRWWGKQDQSTMEAVLAKYGPRIDGDHPTRTFIIKIDGLPVGLIQTYLLSAFPPYASRLEMPDTCAAVDIFIGEISHVGMGWGPLIMRAFMREHVFSSEKVTCCTVDPDLSNASAIRAYEKAGFRHVKTVQFPEDDEPAYVMSIGRAEFSRGE